jgi:hypothetical protein
MNYMLISSSYSLKFVDTCVGYFWWIYYYTVEEWFLFRPAGTEALRV